jgi:hypothetical protein
MRLWHTVTLLIATVLSTSCNNYEMFRLAGYAQDSFSNDADILFILDNSLSMTDEATTLALSIDTFIEKLTNPEASGISSDGLKDAAGNYIEYIQNRGRFVDYNLAITSTDAAADYGRLFGEYSIVSKGDDNETEKFKANVLCETTCFDASDVPSDPAYECGDAAGDSVSFEYLNCLCGEGVWEDNCGSGDEEHLESLYMAMCRSVPEPPLDCYEMNQFTDADILTNDGLLRSTGTFIPIIVTDEGDNSRREATGEYVPAEYETLFNTFGKRTAFAVIGPRTDACNSGGATDWGVGRFSYLVEETQGIWFDIAAEDEKTGDCEIADFASALEELGDLLNTLSTAFPLSSIPDLDTLRVFVEGEEIPASATTLTDSLDIEYSAGWSYSSGDNAVEFHGSAVPDYNENVEIYYLPLDGMPKELPF